jgi:hypothetical protein
MAPRRYEAGWRYLGVLGEPSPEEERFIKALVDRFGALSSRNNKRFSRTGG